MDSQKKPPPLPEEKVSMAFVIGWALFWVAWWVPGIIPCMGLSGGIFA